MDKEKIKNKFWEILMVIKESLDNNPYTSDTQVKEYQKMLGLNGNQKAQGTVVHNFKKQIKEKRNKRTGTNG